MIAPAGLLLLAAQTARPLDVIVRWERPTMQALLLGAAIGAVLALAGRVVVGMWGRRAVAPASVAAAPAVAAPKAARKWSRRASGKVGVQARALAERGASEGEIARRLGVSQDAVAFAMRRAEGEASAGRRRRPAA